MSNYYQWLLEWRSQERGEQFYFFKNVFKKKRKTNEGNDYTVSVLNTTDLDTLVRMVNVILHEFYFNKANHT